MQPARSCSVDWRGGGATTMRRYSDQHSAFFNAAARALGIEIRPDVLSIADQVIE